VYLPVTSSRALASRPIARKLFRSRRAGFFGPGGHRRWPPERRKPALGRFITVEEQEHRLSCCMARELTSVA
jgi:hypothetical protein